LTNFFNAVSGTPYYSILTQYPGTCGSNACLVQNSSTSVHVGGVFVDTRAYAHANGVTAAGSNTDPLFDPDIQHEIQSLINQFSLSDGLGAEFFVYVGSGIQECQGTDTTTCTFNTFCAYHHSFTDSNGNDVVYAFMADVNSLSGCPEGVTTSPSGQISTDREVVITTHELFESVSDPLGNAWVDKSQNEIGDNCNQQTGTTSSDGSNVTLRGARFVVEEIWSNFTSSCSLGLPSLQLQVATGGDDLRDDSSVTVSALSNTGAPPQTFNLKPENQPGFHNNTCYQQMFGFDGTSSPSVSSISITLTSHNSFLERTGFRDDRSLSALRLQPKNAFLRFSRVHRADLESRQRVEGGQQPNQ
jgi:hypothetical protein